MSDSKCSGNPDALPSQSARPDSAARDMFSDVGPAPIGVVAVEDEENEDEGAEAEAEAERERERGPEEEGIGDLLDMPPDAVP